MKKTLYKKNSLKGVLSVPGDKSISHRAVMLGSIAKGRTKITGFLMGEDCLSTINCFRKMGINIEVSNDNTVIVHGNGINGLTAPYETLDVGNSGTTIRLLSGLLCAQSFNSVLTGDDSIKKRPMDRIVIPLKLMNANIKGQSDRSFAPIDIKGKQLKGAVYTLPVASAQVKSAIILAALYADGTTTVIEPEPTRDHTEIMLNYLGAGIKREGKSIICNSINELFAKNIDVPGDISSAAYFIACAILCKDSHLTIKNVGINPTRTGIVDIFKRMGADIQLKNITTFCGELRADIEVKTSKLRGITIEGADIPRLIDEIPVIAVASCFATGTTIIKDAQELKVKESNRIKTVVGELRKLGADISETDDGMIINGIGRLLGNEVNSYTDHRIAMSLSVAALLADGETTINGVECIDISFPGFYEKLKNLYL